MEVIGCTSCDRTLDLRGERSNISLAFSPSSSSSNNCIGGILTQWTGGGCEARSAEDTRRRGERRERSGKGDIAVYINVRPRSIDYVNMMTFRYVYFFRYPPPPPSRSSTTSPLTTRHPLSLYLKNAYIRAWRCRSAYRAMSEERKEEMNIYKVKVPFLFITKFFFNTVSY